MDPIYAFHEHELRPGADSTQYEHLVWEAIKSLRVPGLIRAHHLKGFKGERKGRYAVLWIFESEQAITDNFGTAEMPKWPENWLHYEREVLAKFLDRDPDRITFTDYDLLREVRY